MFSLRCYYVAITNTSITVTTIITIIAITIIIIALLLLLLRYCYVLSLINLSLTSQPFKPLYHGSPGPVPRVLGVKSTVPEQCHSAPLENSGILSVLC